MEIQISKYHYDFLKSYEGDRSFKSKLYLVLTTCGFEYSLFSNNWSKQDIEFSCNDNIYLIKRIDKYYLGISKNETNND